MGRVLSGCSRRDGPAFAAPGADDETLLETLGRMVQQYLYRT